MDEFFFPRNGIKHWSSSHQALLRQHEMANRHAPAWIAPMPQPNLSHLNDLPMPLFSGSYDCGWPPSSGYRVPPSEDELRRSRRNRLLLGVGLCFVPPLAPIGALVLLYCSADKALRLLAAFLESGLVEEWIGRMMRFAWSCIARSFQRAVGQARRRWGPKPQPKPVSIFDGPRHKLPAFNFSHLQRQCR